MVNVEAGKIEPKTEKFESAGIERDDSWGYGRFRLQIEVNMKTLDDRLGPFILGRMRV